MFCKLKQQKSYQDAKICYICKEKFEDKHATDKEYHKVSDHCHYTGEYRDASNNKCNLKYSVTKEIPVVFHNGSNYDQYFIIKKLEEEFEKQFTYLGENTKKYKIFSVPVQKKVIKIDRNG